MGGRRQDHYARRAKAENFPARSIYKLEEIDRRVRLVHPGMKALDLGAAPGSWSLYLSRAVGPSGRVLAIDLKAIEIDLPPNVRVVRGDCGEMRAAIREAGPFDLVVSDMAPSTMGDRATDQYRSFDLFSLALSIAIETGRPGSSFAGKIFQGPSFEEARSALRAGYSDVRVIRPRATRSESYEVFLVGMGRKPGPPDGPVFRVENRGSTH